MEEGEEEALLEMAACPGVCHLAALMLLTLGGKNDLTPQQQRVEMGKGWRSLDVSWTLAWLAFWVVQMWGSEAVWNRRRLKSIRS